MRTLFIFILLSNIALSQKNIQPITSIRVGDISLMDYGFLYTDLSGGVRINESLKIEAHLGSTVSPIKNFDFERMYFVTGALSIGYRFIKKKLSPLIQMETGIQLFSNASNKLFGDRFYFTEKEHQSTIGKFSRFGPYISINSGASYKWKSMEVFITGGYRINQYSYYSYFYSNDFEYLDKELTKKYIKGININLGLTHTFQHNKK